MGYQNETVNVGEQTFTCSECGTVFTRYVKMNALTGKNHFCSRKCSRAFYHRKERKGVEFAEHSRVCRHCGKPFTFRVESYKKECFWPRYCQEPECQAERRRHLADTTKLASVRWHRQKRAEKVEYKRVCKNCGKEFVITAKPGMSEKFLKKCCSDECTGTYKKKLDFIYNRTVKKGLPREDVESMSWSELDTYVRQFGEMPASVTKAVCECCGKEFEYDTRHAGFGHKRKYCSEECKVKGTYARIARERHEKSNHEVECAVCHKKFWSIYPTAKYCSKECKHIGMHRDVYLNPDGTRKEKPAFERECPVCHKVFTTNNNRKRFCSSSCRKAANVVCERRVYDKVCPECGKAFQTDIKKKRFCSDRCRLAFFQKKDVSPKKTVVRTCRQCGREFSIEVPEKQLEKFWPKTCSAECRKAWNDAHPDPFQWRSKPKKEPKTFTCERCGKEFVTTRYSGPHAQRFCSAECRRASILARALASHRKPRVTIKCQICGKEFEAPLGTNRKYCSRKCKRVADYRRAGYEPKDPVVRTCRHCGKEFLTRNSMQLYCGAECKAAYRSAHPELRKYEKKVFEPKTCEVCGKVFTPRAKSQVTCGDPACKSKLNRMRAHQRYAAAHTAAAEPRECPVCHKMFVPGRHHPNQKFCSMQCRVANQIGKYRIMHGVKAPEPRECRHCGKVFTPDIRHPNQAYCSVECRIAETKSPTRPPSPKPCAHCGKIFTPDIRHPNQKYCSKECYDASPTGQKQMAKKAEKTCIICGRTFMGYPHQKTCSRECSYKNRSRGGSNRTSSGQSFAYAEIKVVKAVCRNCGKEFEYERRGRRTERKYCSEKCRGEYWNKYAAELRASMTADPEYVAKREAECVARKAATEAEREKARQERLEKLAALREEKAKAKAELREKIAAMRAMEKEQRAAEREKLRADFRAKKELERLEKVLAAEEAREKAKAEREAAREAERVRKKTEREAAKAEAKKKREAEREARILAAREKRRLVAEETKRLRRERLEKIRSNPEEAERLAKTRAERWMANRVARAAEQRKTTRTREYAEHLAYIEKRRSEGKTIRRSVCKECGQEFEYVVEDLEQRRHNRRAINAMLKSGKTEDDVRKWILNPLEFCTPGCRTHWKYEHGGREKVKAYWQKKKDAGGYWCGRKFVMPKKKDELVSTWRGNGNFYTGSATSDNKYAGLEDYPSDLSIPEQQDEFQFDEDAEAKNFLSD